MTYREKITIQFKMIKKMKQVDKLSWAKIIRSQTQPLKARHINKSLRAPYQVENQTHALFCTDSLENTFLSSNREASLWTQKTSEGYQLQHCFHFTFGLLKSKNFIWISNGAIGKLILHAFPLKMTIPQEITENYLLH